MTVQEAVTEWLPELETEPGQYLDIRLPVQSSHGKSLLGAGVMALFWNGIVSVFVIIGLTDDHLPSLVWLFLSIFIAVGLFLIYNFFRQLLVWMTAGEDNCRGFGRTPCPWPNGRPICEAERAKSRFKRCKLN